MRTTLFALSARRPPPCAAQPSELDTDLAVWIASTLRAGLSPSEIVGYLARVGVSVHYDDIDALARAQRPRAQALRRDRR